MPRDDFNQQTKDILAKRVGYMCSNPKCGKFTSGPHSDSNKAASIGVAAHITAAAKGGPRYDSTLNDKQRKLAENGIWLCQNCAKEIDTDPDIFPVIILCGWKYQAELKVALSPTTSKEAENADLRMKEIYKEINKTLMGVLYLYEYFDKYYEQNFGHFKNLYEAMDSLEKFYDTLHKSALDQIPELKQMENKLLELLRDNILDLDEDLSNYINKFCKLGEFVYQTDGNVGLYNNYYEKFFENVISNQSKRKELRKDISEKIRLNYKNL